MNSKNISLESEEPEQLYLRSSQKKNRSQKTSPKSAGHRGILKRNRTNQNTSENRPETASQQTVTEVSHVGELTRIEYLCFPGVFDWAESPLMRDVLRNN